MNIRTIKEKIHTLERQKNPFILSIEAAQARIQTLTDQIKVLEEVAGIQSAPRLLKKRDPKVRTGKNSSAMLKILSSATSPMTANEVRKVWPADLKPQSVYPTLNDLTKKRKLDRTQVIRSGRKPLYAYTLKGSIREEALWKAEVYR